MVRRRFSLSFYIFVINSFTISCLYDAFLDESNLVFVISLVPVASFHLSSSLVGVLSENILVLMDDGLLTEFSKMLCFFTSIPYRSIFLLLLCYSLGLDSLVMRLVLLWLLFFSKLALVGNLFADCDFILTVMGALALEMEGRTMFPATASNWMAFYSRLSLMFVLMIWMPNILPLRIAARTPSRQWIAWVWQGGHSLPAVS